MEFTHEQKQILGHNPDKHACILAGPGTGKSSTIISYISELRKKHPDKVIRLLTFTRAANRELMEKITEIGQDTILSSTIHSFAISILLKNPGTSGLPEPLRMADDWEWRELIKKDFAKRLSTTAATVDKLKNEMSAQWESLSPEEDKNVSQEVRGHFMGLWEEHRRIFKYALLAELPFRLKIALEGNPDLDLGNLDLIAVDEYQDLNACDLKCIRIISEHGIVVIAIGDDDQSIYRFRKAHPAGIRNFPKEYQAVSYPLTISHRCGSKILEWANYIIQGDTSRLPKPSLRVGSNNSAGLVGYFVFNRESQEADGIANLVKWLNEKERVPLEEILILVRTGSIANLIENKFKELNICYADPEEALNLLHHQKTRELLCILRLFAKRKDSLSWWTILHLTHGIGHNTINEIYKLARQNDSSFGATIIAETENGFENIKLSKRNLLSRANEVLEIIGKLEVPDNARWGNWIKEQIKNRKLPELPSGMGELLTKIDNLKEEKDQIDLNQYVNQIEPVVKDMMNSKTSNRVRIMTLYRSKGLTVRATIIAGAEDGIIPHPIGDRQEERRLLYVGMTRSRNYLYITRCRRRTGPTARSGQTNVAKTRSGCPFLDGGPVDQTNGETELKRKSL